MGADCGSVVRRSEGRAAALSREAEAGAAAGAKSWWESTKAVNSANIPMIATKSSTRNWAKGDGEGKGEGD